MGKIFTLAYREGEEVRKRFTGVRTLCDGKETRLSEVTLTNQRVIIDINSTDSFLKREIHEIPYSEIHCIEASSDINKWGVGITYASGENGGIGLSFGRNHLRACQIYLLACQYILSGYTSSDSGQIRRAKQIRIIANTPEDIFNSDKDNVKKIFSKSLSLNKDLSIGHILTLNDLESKKPSGYGIDVNDYKSVIGKKLSNSKKQNDFLNLNDILE